jgi:nitrite reductase/ring-hydroxylating ferredoxin subunit
MSDDCHNCPLIDRRSFLATALLLPVISGIRIGLDEKSYAIPAVDGVQIDKDQDVIISRTQGKVFAFNLGCPHQNTAIRWDNGKTRFQCPKHKSIYTPEGVFVEGRATRGLDRFAVRKDGNSIVVNLDLLFEQDKDVEKWSKAFVIP